MRYFGLLLAAVLGMSTVAFAPVAASAAESGATLTVPAQVSSSTGRPTVVEPSFSYPEPTPFCTVGVDFTWDGAAWLAEFPVRSGTLCVASGPGATAPSGHDGAGPHEVCGSAGPAYHVCKTVTILAAAGAASPGAASPRGPSPGGATPGGTSGGASGAASPGAPSHAASAPAAVPTDAVDGQAPATGPLAVAGRLPVQPGIGLVLLAVGVVGLALVLGRLLLGRLRRKPEASGPE